MPHQTMGDYQTLNTLETFGFLPKFSQDEIYAQINYLIAQGWTPAIEHEHPSRSFDHYWTMWKLPFFGETNLGKVVEDPPPSVGLPQKRNQPAVPLARPLSCHVSPEAFSI